MKYLYKPPSVIQNIFSDFTWRTTNNKILLTFDDSPNEKITESILKKLDEEKIKALFFCVGENVKKNPDIIKTILNEDHEIGNHTFHHKNILKLSRAKLENEIRAFNEMMEDKFLCKLKYFRPPYGKFNLGLSRILKRYELRNVMWSLLTYDFEDNLNRVKLAVENYLQPDSIVVLHDNIKSEEIILDSISIIIEEAAKKNYEIGEPEECLN